jgi:hypothetical protein
MSYYYQKPTPDFIRSHHVSNLERAFGWVNKQVRDWSYMCSLEEWHYGRWYDGMLNDAGTLERVIQNPEITELTEKALVIIDSARREFIDSAEFNATVAKLREVLA